MQFARSVVLLFFAISISTACFGGESSEVKNKSYQYVKLFNGDFPIPLRFELISWSDTSLEYSSPAPLHQLNDGSLMLETPLIGSISIELASGLDEYVGRRAVVTLIATCGSLEIKRVSPVGVQEGLEDKIPPAFLIIGDTHYLAVNDYDEGLWRELVALFAKHMQIPVSSCQL